MDAGAGANQIQAKATYIPREPCSVCWDRLECYDVGHGISEYWICGGCRRHRFMGVRTLTPAGSMRLGWWWRNGLILSPRGLSQYQYPNNAFVPEYANYFNALGCARPITEDLYEAHLKSGAPALVCFALGLELRAWR